MTIRVLNTKNEPVQQKGIQIDEKFLINIQGKDFVLYAGLLDLAHQRGLKKLVVEILQFPNQENDNTVICRAVAETEDGDVFTDIGDANPKNTNKKIIAHIIRMASTRAKARCLRDLTNIGLCSVEELGDINGDDVAGADLAAPKKAAANGYHVQTGNGKGNGKGDKAPKASIAQIKAIEGISQRLKIKNEILVKMLSDQYGVSLPDLSSAQAANFIRFLQKAS